MRAFSQTGGVSQATAVPVQLSPHNEKMADHLVSDEPTAGGTIPTTLRLKARRKTLSVLDGCFWEWCTYWLESAMGRQRNGGFLVCLLESCRSAFGPLAP